MPPKGKGGEGSVLDGLKSIYTEIANLQLAPDAQQHQQVLQALQQAIQKYLQMQAQQKAQQMAQMQQIQARQLAGPQGAAGGINPQMGGPHPGMGGPPGPPPGGPGGPPSQGSPGIAMPNPEELQRVLATQGQGG